MGGERHIGQVVTPSAAVPADANADERGTRTWRISSHWKNLKTLVSWDLAVAMRRNVHVRICEMDSVVPCGLHHKPVLCIHEFYAPTAQLSCSSYIDAMLTFRIVIDMIRLPIAAGNMLGKWLRARRK